MSITPNHDRQILGQQYRDYYGIKNSDGSVIVGPIFNEPLGLPVIVYRDFLSISSVNTPNFRRIKSGLLPDNPYSKSAWSQRTPISLVTNDDIDSAPGGSSTFYKVNVSTGAMPGFDASTLADDQTQKIISKLIEQIGTAKADAATSLAEMGKTARHVAHTAQRVAGALISLKKGRFGDFAKSLGITYTTRRAVIYNRRWARAVKDDTARKVRYDKLYVKRGESRVTDLVADTWLEYSYGWKPLLKDVYDAAQATASVMVERSKTMRYQTAKSRSQKSTKTKVVNAPPTANIVETEWTSERYFAIGVNFRIPNGAIGITDAFGLSNPLTVAWELIPFSFVVDWFLPVGDAIRGLTAFSGLEFAGGWLSTRHVWQVKRKITITSWSSGSMSHKRSGSYSGDASGVDINRVYLTSFPNFGFPQWKDPRSFAHAASATALLQSLFLRK
jgi:hypothetical protein